MSLALAVVFAIILLAVILQDAFEVMLLPRRVRRRLRLTTTIFGGAWAFWRVIDSRLSPGRRREAFLLTFAQRLRRIGSKRLKAEELRQRSNDSAKSDAVDG